MPKRKKYPKLPNGWGQIRYLGKGRTLPYAVHPPATDRDDTGRYIRPAALCYVPDWYTGFGVLSAYHAGQYEPGLETQISAEVKESNVNLDAFCKRVIRSAGFYKQDDSLTLEEVYQQYKEWEFGENAAKKLSSASVNAYQQGYNYLAVLKDRPINTITLEDLQQIVNNCDKKKATRQNIVLAAKQIWKYAMPRKLCDENVAQFLILPSGRENEHGVPFTDNELSTFWKNRNDDTIAFLLIMCYSGFRISAYLDMTVNLEEGYFQGGVKNASSKNRIVPIHSAIRPIVEARIRRYGGLLTTDPHIYRTHMADAMKRLKMDPHTPHDCRHTFSRLCEKYSIREADRKRMLGHSFGGDITNAVYGHRTLEELRTEIEKIKIPEFVGICGD